jgi:solute carrier family 50 (sugar transporter)
MVSAGEILLEYAAPAAGCVTGFLMFVASVPDVYRAAGKGCLGDLNPAPWAFMLGNCVGWIIYGILLRDFFVFFANVPGFLMACWLNMKAVELLSSGRATVFRESLVIAITTQKPTREEEVTTSNGINDDPSSGSNGHCASATSLDALIAKAQSEHASARLSQPHEILVMAIIIIWLSITSVMVFAKNNAISSNTKELIVGISVNVNLVFFYGAPLSTIWTVLNDKSSSTIHFRTMVTSTANGTFWFAYGVAVQDFFIMVPNGLGALLGCAQMVLCLIFPRKLTQATKTGGSPSTLPALIEEGRQSRYGSTALERPADK